jgi:hypothetical protein
MYARLSAAVPAPRAAQRPRWHVCTLALLAIVAVGCSDSNTTADRSSPIDARVDTRPDVCDPKVQPFCLAPDLGRVDGPRGDKPRAPDKQLAASFCGVVEDDKGAKVVGAEIIICKVACFSGSSVSGGAFCIDVDAADDYLFHAAERQVGAKHYGDTLFPVTMTAAEFAAHTKVDLGTIVQPLLGPAVALDPVNGGTLDLGGGSSLVVPAGVTTLPPLKPSVTVALATVAPSKIHPKLIASRTGAPAASLGATLTTLGVTFSSPVSYALAGSGLASGTQLEVYKADDATGVLSAHGQAKVDTAGKIVDVSGQGITGLGWFVFYAK